ncbi:Mucin-like protein [Phytophthora cinnamomi]|uniref:Mucin-like protein n=1 Tax=Phytophthora cinnamomi TaxID=4785 RepID=UPI00355A6DB0|nr:Mucin-like protein [Phytophthora cinnamomi]
MQLNALLHAILAGVALSATSISAACINVSVEADATYCINGPICSGSGSAPAGSLCPTKGAVAVKDCSNNKLPSWTSAGSCVAPADAVCAKIKTGAWGCVYSTTKSSNSTANSTTAVTPAPTTTVKPGDTTTNSTTAVTPAPTTTAPKAGNSTANSTAAVTPAPTMTVKPRNTTTNSTTAVTPAPTTTAPKAGNSTTNSTAAVTPALTTTAAKPSNTTTNLTSTSTSTNKTCINVSVEDQNWCLGLRVWCGKVEQYHNELDGDGNAFSNHYYCIPYDQASIDAGSNHCSSYHKAGRHAGHHHPGIDAVSYHRSSNHEAGIDAGGNHRGSNHEAGIDADGYHSSPDLNHHQLDGL